METITVKVKTLAHFDESFELPFYATPQAAGADVKASFTDKKPLTLMPGERKLIPTGLCFEIPESFEIQVRPRSGLSLKSPLLILNSPGTVDADYRGELCVIVGNLGNTPYVIEHGLRIAQLVLSPVTQGHFLRTQDLSLTERGDGGFGSTGKF